MLGSSTPVDNLTRSAADTPVPQATDTLPGVVATDLTLASTFIPAGLLHVIANQIMQIDLSLYGMSGRFDPDTSLISRSEFADLFQPSTPINSTASFAESFVVHNAEFA